MNFYYNVNGTRINLQRVWMVLDTSDNSFSIAHALNDLSNYINNNSTNNTGIFGIKGTNSRNLGLIVLFIIFISAGVMSYKFGVSSPAAIGGFIFGLVWLFDIQFGWIPTPFKAVPHIATWLTAFILFGLIVKEVTE